MCNRLSNRKLLYKLSLMAMLLTYTSCQKDSLYKDDLSVDTEEVETSTYANLLINIPGAPPPSTYADYDLGDPKEYAVNNLMLFFFGKNLKLEAKALVNVSDLDMVTDTTHPTSTSVSYRLKTPLMVTSGKKRVVALLNVNAALQTKLAGIDNYYSLYNYEIKPSGNFLGDMGVINGSTTNTSYYHNFTNLLMSGETEVNLKGSVTQSDVLLNGTNLIGDLHVDRTMSKMTVKFDNFVFPNGLALIGGVYNLYVHVGNIPTATYLMRHGWASPNYTSTDWSKWFNAELVRPTVTSSAISNLKTRSFQFYMAENTFSQAYRGNAQYLGFLFRCYYRDNAHYWQFYDEQTKAKSIINVAPLPIDRLYNVTWDTATGRTNMKNGIVSYIRTVASTGNSFTTDHIIDMSSYDKSEAAQNAALVANGIATPSGYYLFLYRTEKCDPNYETERWYDELQLYKYSGAGFTRSDRREIKAAFFTAGNLYYRLNLQDTDYPTTSSLRYGVRRNTFYTVQIKGIKSSADGLFLIPGYPRANDLDRLKDQKLTASALEADVNVVDWEDGGSHDVEVGN